MLSKDAIATGKNPEMRVVIHPYRQNHPQSPWIGGTGSPWIEERVRVAAPEKAAKAGPGAERWPCKTQHGDGWRRTGPPLLCVLMRYYPVGTSCCKHVPGM